MYHCRDRILDANPRKNLLRVIIEGIVHHGEEIKSADLMQLLLYPVSKQGGAMEGEQGTHREKDTESAEKNREREKIEEKRRKR